MCIDSFKHQSEFITSVLAISTFHKGGKLGPKSLSKLAWCQTASKCFKHMFNSVLSDRSSVAGRARPRGLLYIFGLCQYGGISVLVIILSLHPSFLPWLISPCVCVVDTFVLGWNLKHYVSQLFAIYAIYKPDSLVFLHIPGGENVV